MIREWDVGGKLGDVLHFIFSLTPRIKIEATYGLNLEWPKLFFKASVCSWPGGGQPKHHKIRMLSLVQNAT